jgi:hypothetical protein
LPSKNASTCWRRILPPLSRFDLLAQVLESLDLLVDVLDGHLAPQPGVDLADELLEGLDELRVGQVSQSSRFFLLL